MTINDETRLEQLREALLGNRSLGELIKTYSKEGDLGDLIFFLDRPLERTNALYILSEVGARACAVWQEVIPYTADADPATAYWALDVVQACASEQDGEKILKCLSAVDLASDATFAKMCSILALAPAGLIKSMQEQSKNADYGALHISGLKLLSDSDDLSAVKRALNSQLPHERLYGCAAVCRHWRTTELVSLLPQFVQEDLAVDGAALAKRVPSQ
jgi:hypothetical protein